MKRKINKLPVFLLLVTMIFTASIANAFAYTGMVCQGDTGDISDVTAFKTGLESKSYTVTPKGSVGNGATSSDFINAKNYDVLYWSSHGSTAPALNVINGPSFNVSDTLDVGSGSSNCQ